MPQFRLINIKSKFRKLLTLLPLLAFLSSCDPGCVEPYQFDSENEYVNSNPIKDGIFGDPYNHSSGGENAAWHPTGLRTDGNELVLEIRGAWTPWGYANNQAKLNALEECTICAKRSGVANCICKIGEDSEPEKDNMGVELTTAAAANCLNTPGSFQDNPDKCTCTKAHGTINDFGTYFLATNYLNKDEGIKLADEQDPCKYTAGLGLYVGLFGKNNNTMPLRVYQVYPTQEICDITRIGGECIDNFGNDQTKYVYRSPNGRIFIKDDKSGNSGTDTNPNDDEYHEAGEFVKFIVNDGYYRDNFGGYDVNFMSGFIRNHDSYLLEYIVGTVEDSVLGKVSDVTDKREGGVIEFLYNSIVKDSSFILIVQLCLIMYVTLFGIYVLSGNIEISNKEISKRVIKIALVIFFTTETSWYVYNQFVVGLFKDGMDSIITIFMDGADKGFDETSLIFTSQLDRATSISNATRFSYIDEVIKKLLSASVSKKIWGLFFGTWFGFIYIPIIYALIFAFVYIMLTAAIVYIVALLRLVFVLCLGPIFMVTVLFNKTDEIFKRWLSFMASQTIQIICLFLVIYLFLIIIDVEFTGLLHYRTCASGFTIGPLSISILKSEPNRDIVEWVMRFTKIAGFLFLLKMIMEKIPGFAANMVSINSQSIDAKSTFIASTNQSAFALANTVMGAVSSAAGSTIKRGVPWAVSKGMDVARFTGVNNFGNSIRRAMPFRSPVNMYRDRQIDNIIKAKQQEGKAAGYSGKDLDAFVRKGTFDEISSRTSIMDKSQSNTVRVKSTANKLRAQSTANKFNIIGVSNNEAILKRLDKKLVEEPLKKEIKELKKEIKEQIAQMKQEHLEQGTPMPLSKAELNEELRPRIEKWAAEKSSIDQSKFLNILDQKKYSSLVKEHGALTSAQAAKMFAGDEEGTKRYLQHLQERQFEKERKNYSGTWLRQTINPAKDRLRGLQRKSAYNPKIARRNFLRKKEWEERRMDKQSEYGLFKQGLSEVGINPEKGLSPFKRINIVGQKYNKYRGDGRIEEAVRKAEAETLSEYLKNGYGKEIEQIKKKHADKVNTLGKQAKTEPRDYRKAKATMDSELKLAAEKRDFFKKLRDKYVDVADTAGYEEPKADAPAGTANVDTGKPVEVSAAPNITPKRD